MNSSYQYLDVFADGDVRLVVFDKKRFLRGVAVLRAMEVEQFPNFCVGKGQMWVVGPLQDGF